MTDFHDMASKLAEDILRREYTLRERALEAELRAARAEARCRELEARLARIRAEVR